MERQVELAQSYGVYGFCFYYYWFSGRKLLEKPLEYFLHSDIDFHFHLCWATENWSKRWDGGKNELIVEQHLSVDDADLFFTDILPFIRDPRYEQIKGKPLLVVYRVDMFEKEIFTSFFDRLNALAIAHGFNGFHLLCTNAFRFDNPIDYGCHGLVEFPPHGIKNENYELTKPILCTTSDFKIIDMSAYLRDKMHLYDREYPVFKTCFPGWDNTPRKLYNQGFCFMLTPEEFQRWLEDNIIWTRKNHGIEEQIVYINAWNEWGEGAILEPTTRYGYRNLDSLKQVVENTRTHHRK
jgi:lipopolysaccharide biosynthesis protein